MQINKIQIKRMIIQRKTYTQKLNIPQFIQIKPRNFPKSQTKPKQTTTDAGSSYLEMNFMNPFTASACKISGLKSAHIHSSRQYIWRSCSKSTFNTSPFTWSCEWGKKALMISSLALSLVVFWVTARQICQWKGYYSLTAFVQRTSVARTALYAI